jgi:peptidoglycan/xylan/chitin deacetylase (PgdA/CDA1 family)
MATGAWLATVCPDVIGSAAQTTLVPRSLAVTFDDLPYVDSGEAQLSKARRVTGELLRVLASHRVPVVAFVNEAKLGSGSEVGARTALLQQWVDAGAVLGNHTYSHADLNTLTVQQFEDNILRGEVVTRRLMQSRQPYQRYFRHPQTHTGDTQAKKEAVEEFLAARGYRIAPHTIDSSDFVFNAALVHARNSKDAASVTRLQTAYLDFVVSATEFAERISPQVFGRDIPQTIVLHANDINAECLDELLQRLETRGYHFVTLENAMADPAYRTRDTLVTRSGPTWLWRWMKSMNMTLSFKG